MSDESNKNSDDIERENAKSFEKLNKLTKDLKAVVEHEKRVSGGVPIFKATLEPPTDF